MWDFTATCGILTMVIIGSLADVSHLVKSSDNQNQEYLPPPDEYLPPSGSASGSDSSQIGFLSEFGAGSSMSLSPASTSESSLDIDPDGAGQIPTGIKPLGDDDPVKDEDHHHHHYHGQDGKYNPDDDGTGWDIRLSVPGEPGRDYPTLDTAPSTTFSCLGRHAGYYADVEAECQVFQVCTGGFGKGISFLCPNGTIFNQAVLTCDWWSNVDCDASENHFSKNNDIGVSPDGSMTSEVKKMLIFPMQNPLPVKDYKGSTMIEYQYKLTKERMPKSAGDQSLSNYPSEFTAVRGTAVEDFLPENSLPSTTRKYYTPTVPSPAGPTEPTRLDDTPVSSEFLSNELASTSSSGRPLVRRITNLNLRKSQVATADQKFTYPSNSNLLSIRKPAQSVTRFPQQIPVLRPSDLDTKVESTNRDIKPQIFNLGVPSGSTSGHFAASFETKHNKFTTTSLSGPDFSKDASGSIDRPLAKPSTSLVNEDEPIDNAGFEIIERNEFGSDVSGINSLTTKKPLNDQYDESLPSNLFGSSVSKTDYPTTTKKPSTSSYKYPPKPSPSLIHGSSKVKVGFAETHQFGPHVSSVSAPTASPSLVTGGAGFGIAESNQFGSSVSSINAPVLAQKPTTGYQYPKPSPSLVTGGGSFNAGFGILESNQFGSSVSTINNPTTTKKPSTPGYQYLKPKPSLATGGGSFNAGFGILESNQFGSSVSNINNPTTTKKPSTPGYQYLKPSPSLVTGGGSYNAGFGIGESSQFGSSVSGIDYPITTKKPTAGYQYPKPSPSLVTGGGALNAGFGIQFGSSVSSFNVPTTTRKPTTSGYQYPTPSPTLVTGGGSLNAGFGIVESNQFGSSVSNIDYPTTKKPAAGYKYPTPSPNLVTGGGSLNAGFGIVETNQFGSSVSSFNVPTTTRKPTTSGYQYPTPSPSIVTGGGSLNTGFGINQFGSAVSSFNVPTTTTAGYNYPKPTTSGYEYHKPSPSLVTGGGSFNAGFEIIETNQFGSSVSNIDVPTTTTEAEGEGYEYPIPNISVGGSSSSSFNITGGFAASNSSGSFVQINTTEIITTTLAPTTVKPTPAIFMLHQRVSINLGQSSEEEKSSISIINSSGTGGAPHGFLTANEVNKELNFDSVTSTSGQSQTIQETKINIPPKLHVPAIGVNDEFNKNFAQYQPFNVENLVLAPVTITGNINLIPSRNRGNVKLDNFAGKTASSNFSINEELNSDVDVRFIVKPKETSEHVHHVSTGPGVLLPSDINTQPDVYDVNSYTGHNLGSSLASLSEQLHTSDQVNEALGLQSSRLFHPVTQTVQSIIPQQPNNYEYTLTDEQRYDIAPVAPSAINDDHSVRHQSGQQIPAQLHLTQPSRYQHSNQHKDVRTEYAITNTGARSEKKGHSDERSQNENEETDTRFQSVDELIKEIFQNRNGQTEDQTNVRSQNENAQLDTGSQNVIKQTDARSQNSNVQTDLRSQKVIGQADARSQYKNINLDGRHQNRNLQTDARSQNKNLKTDAPSQNRNLQTDAISQNENLKVGQRFQNGNLQQIDVRFLKENGGTDARFQNRNLQTNARTQNGDLQTDARNQNRYEQTDGRSQHANGLIDSGSQYVNSHNDARSKYVNGQTSTQYKSANQQADGRSYNRNGQTDTQSQYLNSQTDARSHYVNGQTSSRPQYVNSQTDARSQYVISQPDERTNARTQNGDLQTDARSQNGYEQTDSGSQYVNSHNDARSNYANGQTSTQYEAANQQADGGSYNRNRQTYAQSQYLNSQTDARSHYVNGQINSQPQYVNSQTDARPQYVNGQTDARFQYVNGHTDARSQYVNGQADVEITRSIGFELSSDFGRQELESAVQRGLFNDGGAVTQYTNIGTNTNIGYSGIGQRNIADSYSVPLGSIGYLGGSRPLFTPNVQDNSRSNSRSSSNVEGYTRDRPKVQFSF